MLPIDRMPRFFIISKVIFSIGLGSGPPSDMLITFAPALLHLRTALASVDE